MLEARRVRGVTRDGDIDIFVLHDGNAFLDGVSAVALDLCTLRIRAVLDLLDDVELARLEVVVRHDIREAVDAADDLSSILAETVEDDAQRVLADLVGRLSDTDSALSSCEGLVACEECEAASILREEHSAEVAVAETDLAVVSNRTRYAESLEAFADSLSGISSLRAALLDGDGSTERVSPFCILECDRLEIFYDLIRVDALLVADFLSIFNGSQTILFADFVDFINTALIAFE